VICYCEQEDKGPLVSDLVELIDREANLLCHGFSQKNLEGLRKRISHLFLQYMRTPAYNPEVRPLLKVRIEVNQNYLSTTGRLSGAQCGIIQICDMSFKV